MYNYSVIFQKNLPYEDLFTIFLTFRGYGRIHFARFPQCSPPEIFFLCLNVPCMAMVGLLTVQKNYFNCFLYANIMILVFSVIIHRPKRVQNQGKKAIFCQIGTSLPPSHPHQSLKNPPKPEKHS